MRATEQLLCVAALACLQLLPVAGFLPSVRSLCTGATGCSSSCAAPAAARSASKVLPLQAKPNALVDLSDDEWEASYQFVDPESGSSIECYIETMADVEGRRYAMGFPADDAVAIAMEQEGEVVPVPVDDPLMDTLFPILQKDLKEQGGGLEIKRTPVVLTMTGLEDEDEEDDKEDLTTDEDDHEGHEDDEDVELISDLDVNGEKFLLIRYVEPYILLAEVKGSGKSAKYTIIDPDESERISAIVDDLIDAEVMSSGGDEEADDDE